MSGDKRERVEAKEQKNGPEAEVQELDEKTRREERKHQKERE